MTTHETARRYPLSWPIAEGRVSFTYAEARRVHGAGRTPRVYQQVK